MAASRSGHASSTRTQLADVDALVDQVITIGDELTA